MGKKAAQATPNQYLHWARLERKRIKRVVSSAHWLVDVVCWICNGIEP
jgi:hypothetical protein